MALYRSDFDDYLVVNDSVFDSLTDLQSSAFDAVSYGAHKFLAARTATDSYILWDANADGDFDATAGDDLIIKLAGVTDLSSFTHSSILGSDAQPG